MGDEGTKPAVLNVETYGGGVVLGESAPSAPAVPEAGHLDVVGEPPAQDPYDGSLSSLFENAEYRKDEPEEPKTLKDISQLRRSAWTTKAPVEIRYKHKFLAHLFALGLPRYEISRKTGYTEEWLTTIARHPDFAAEIDKTRKEVFGESLEQNLRMQLPQAVKVVADILNNPNSKDNVRMETAFRVMDRTHGKPAQRVEHTGSLLKDLFAELDARDAAKTTIITETAKPTVDGEAEWSQTENSTPSSTTDESADAITGNEDAVSAFMKETYGEKET